MKIREIREMTDEEILNALEDQKEAMFNLRFQKASGQLEDTNAPRRTRRDHCAVEDSSAGASVGRRNGR